MYEDVEQYVLRSKDDPKIKWIFYIGAERWAEVTAAKYVDGKWWRNVEGTKKKLREHWDMLIREEGFYPTRW